MIMNVKYRAAQSKSLKKKKVAIMICKGSRKTRGRR